MKEIVLRFVCIVAILLASVGFWSGVLAQKDAPPPPPPPSSPFDPTGTPCADVSCTGGRHCAVNENNSSSCVCDTACYSSPTDPPSRQVCGSNNRTYASLCELNRDACITNTRVQVMYFSQCNDIAIVCSGVTCASNRECAIADHRPICVCIQKCPPFSDPVCGSDNQTYINDCDLQRESCLRNVSITSAYPGQCNAVSACDNVTCSEGLHCAVNERHRPVCVCLDQCPDDAEPGIVCGTDGRTYGTRCELLREACTSAKTTRVANKGICIGDSVCSGHRCASDRQCTVDQNNQPFCGCVQNCLYNWDPVCGSDGITYQNLCDFNRLTCLAGVNVTVVRTGQCSYDQFCEGVVCPALMSCFVNAQNQSNCSCNTQCNDFYYPVCGSDNKTHLNYCQLNVDACVANTSITGLYDGVCSQGPNCAGVSCPTGQHCDSRRHQAEPKCVCDTVCPSTSSSPLCGSNNKTYNNNCELQRDACLTNATITVQFNRRCKDGPECDFTSCPYDQMCQVNKQKQALCVCSLNCDPTTYEVCGTDDKTYSNECFLTVAACLSKADIAVQYSGKCHSDSPCNRTCSSDRYCVMDSKGKATCVCNEDCTGLGSPVCGSDRKTYGNLCELQKKVCLTDAKILWRYYGRCVEGSVCDRHRCPSEKTCAVDGQNEAVCVCINECPDDECPVCGSDGNTYMNECELEKAACILGTKVKLAYRGQCSKGVACPDVTCSEDRICAVDDKKQSTCVCNTVCYSFFPYSQVCGTDGQTYDSECHLQRKACTTGTHIEVDYSGPCDNGGSTTTTSAGI